MSRAPNASTGMRHRCLLDEQRRRRPFVPWWAPEQLKQWPMSQCPSKSVKLCTQVSQPPSATVDFRVGPFSIFSYTPHSLKMHEVRCNTGRTHPVPIQYMHDCCSLAAQGSSISPSQMLTQDYQISSLGRLQSRFHLVHGFAFNSFSERASMLVGGASRAGVKPTSRGHRDCPRARSFHQLCA